jgi:6,7-dimethyl-8-ribityllumazine synthase
MARPQAPAHGLPALRLHPAARVAAVVSLYHSELTLAMCASARATLEAAGLTPAHFFEVHAPGAFELPLLARRLARRDDVEAVLCFGLVLRGETTHNEHVARAATDGLARVALECDKPVLFGLLTCDDLDQARARALPPDQGGTLDKGAEVARAALEALRAIGAIDAERNRGGWHARSQGRGGRVVELSASASAPAAASAQSAQEPRP